MAAESEPKYLFAKMVRGHPFPDAPMFPVENIEFTMDYVPLDGDIIIASYPKTGTTWLQYIVLQILSKGTSFPQMIELKTKTFPYMEMAGKQAVENMDPPRILNHHLPYNLMQKNPNSKVIYIYRRPEDVCISFYHFATSVFHSEIDKDDFFEAFISGKVLYGGYFDHVLSFWKHKGDTNLLFVSYEKLLADTQAEILKIARFIGQEYYDELSENETLLKQIIQKTSFKTMKKELTPTEPSNAGKEDAKNMNSSNPSDAGKEEGKNINFFRKGVVGDGTNVYSSEQLARLKAVLMNKMKGTLFISEWMN